MTAVVGGYKGVVDGATRAREPAACCDVARTSNVTLARPRCRERAVDDTGARTT
jgi:hypothetical protein